MYSYEDRVRAVKLYLKLGKRVKATIRQLGYPTKKNVSDRPGLVKTGNSQSLKDQQTDLTQLLSAIS